MYVTSKVSKFGLTKGSKYWATVDKYRCYKVHLYSGLVTCIAIKHFEPIGE